MWLLELELELGLHPGLGRFVTSLTGVVPSSLSLSPQFGTDTDPRHDPVSPKRSCSSLKPADQVDGIWAQIWCVLSTDGPSGQAVK